MPLLPKTNPNLRPGPSLATLGRLFTDQLWSQTRPLWQLALIPVHTKGPSGVSVRILFLGLQTSPQSFRFHAGTESISP